MKIKPLHRVVILFTASVAVLAACQKEFPPPLNPANDISNGVVPGLTYAQLQEHA